MNIILLVPRVAQKFVEQLPEVRNNAYSYFNYDHRVVNERVNRADMPSMYVGPDEFKDADYTDLVRQAKLMINPILQKYSPRVATEDALNMAIRSFANGRFDGKVNANKFALLSKIMLDEPVAQMQQWSPIMAKGKEEKPKKEPPKQTDKVVIPRRILKQLGIKPRDVKPFHTQKIKTPHMLRERGDIVLHKGE
jgi:hypothetical protein